MVARLQQSHSKSLCFSLASHQTLSPHLHHEPGPPTRSPRCSSLHLDELGPRRQLPLRSAEVEQ